MDNSASAFGLGVHRQVVNIAVGSSGGSESPLGRLLVILEAWLGSRSCFGDHGVATRSLEVVR